MPVQRVLAVAALATCLIPTAIGEWRCGTVPNARKGIISNECGLDSAALLAAFASHGIGLDAQLTCDGGGRYQTAPDVPNARDGCDEASAALTALFVAECTVLPPPCLGPRLLPLASPQPPTNVSRASPSPFPPSLALP